ncbi:hypothetical protein [Maledivibacter halophilus]|uniref:Uncharacterized protein n=1 Tax=Maledivibacter halophilus TaxID=36842 RepID=A0A1T5KEB9_9FIRM|nr:hypothetical protein [Maledivibacter halophilus]SKC62031.1 hypothetical protein SAMN02194393_01732 [Maledivibacter halophilus]
MAKYIRAVPERKDMLKKSELKVNLDIGDRVSVKYKEKGRHGKKEVKGKVILNDMKHPYFQIHTGHVRKSFLKVDVVIGAIEVKRIS